MVTSGIYKSTLFDLEEEREKRKKRIQLKKHLETCAKNRRKRKKRK